MSQFTLEDFGSATATRPAMSTAGSTPPDRFDDGYNAGWDDAMAQVESEQTRVAERFAERLDSLEHDRKSATAAVLHALEPTLRDIFDKLLPRTVERAFLPLLLSEIETVLSADNSRPVLHIAPEEEAAVRRLLERAAIGPDRLTVRPEPALTISQALIRWDGQERRVDLEGALSALDDALETFLATMNRDADTGAVEQQEALHG